MEHERTNFTAATCFTLFSQQQHQTYMLFSSHLTRTVVHWVIGFLLAYALQLVLVWAVKDPTIQITLFGATQLPFLFLFCLTVTIIYSRGGAGAGKEKSKANRVAVETAVSNESNAADSNTATANINDEQKSTSRPVLHYLTNLKIFLTFTVVTHHMAVAFGGVPAAPLVIGAYPNWFRFAAGIFLNLNQSYFMPLFYFISAYFCESSYNRKGRSRFMHAKAQRYLLPSAFIIFTLNPYSQMIANAVAGLAIYYFPLVFHYG